MTVPGPAHSARRIYIGSKKILQYFYIVSKKIIFAV